MILYVVRSFRIYDGDNIYGVFDNLDKAKNIKSKLKDSDVEVVEVTLNSVMDGHDEYSKIIDTKENLWLFI